jgi:hypothetical protein
MWLTFAIGGALLAVVVAVAARMLRRRSRRIDLGSVSDAWLAEHRIRRPP